MKAEKKEIEEIKLIIAENMATYSKAKMPYEEALNFCALGIMASGYRKGDEVNQELVKELIKENEKLKEELKKELKEHEDFTNNIKSVFDIEKEYIRNETAKEILQHIKILLDDCEDINVRIHYVGLLAWLRIAFGVEVEE